MTTPQYTRVPLTIEQQNHLEGAALTWPERLLIWVLLDTGLRIAELCAMQSKDYDFQQHRLTVNGKGGKLRVVPTTARAHQLMSICFSFGGVPFGVRTAQRLCREVASRGQVEVPVTPHVLRHTFAVRTLQAGVSLPTLQRMLGHSRLRTTEQYLNLSPDAAIREMQERGCV